MPGTKTLAWGLVGKEWCPGNAPRWRARPSSARGSRVPGEGKMPPVPQDSAMDQVFFALDEISLESSRKVA